MLKKETGATVTIPVLPERARSECARSMGAVGIVTATPRDEAHSLRPRWAAFLNILQELHSLQGWFDSPAVQRLS